MKTQKTLKLICPKFNKQIGNLSAAWEKSISGQTPGVVKITAILYNRN